MLGVGLFEDECCIQTCRKNVLPMVKSELMYSLRQIQLQNAAGTEYTGAHAAAAFHKPGGTNESIREYNEEKKSYSRS